MSCPQLFTISLGNPTRNVHGSLKESGLGPKFWAEAVSTAAYLRNKCPFTAIDGDIPERIWSGKEVHINHMRVFGCRTWSHVHSHSIQRKLDPKAGYPEGV
ncbi:hypothetical protein AVEN_49007-1 [Araneus ventricosus]|uniref:Retrovirus-related Pol polyprotein from transposon TNT 1-94 n=1 Tax=Araneus ventricosus TaxID=182803 RepID=A0A4Y2AGX6_ARAVE|nr:hypothetical protein AVEN_49007-1 [Araneus ventricosus]